MPMLHPHDVDAAVGDVCHHEVDPGVCHHEIPVVGLAHGNVGHHAGVGDDDVGVGGVDPIVVADRDYDDVGGDGVVSQPRVSHIPVFRPLYVPFPWRTWTHRL